MEQIPSEIRAEIERRLSQIENERNVRIFYACESGSRAWGFPSANSDYDVRFLYINEPNWYLSVFRQRDVIELPITDEIDVSGWDLRKTLQLLFRSNPALQEWLSCPIKYRVVDKVLAPLSELSVSAFNPLAGYHHYLSMARQHLTRMREDELVKLKHYLYTLRPLLACMWITEHQCQPPMLFDELLRKFVPAGPLLDRILGLVELKSGGSETSRVRHVSELDEYIYSTYSELVALPAPQHGIPDVASFDAAFLAMLELAWTE